MNLCALLYSCWLSIPGYCTVVTEHHLAVNALTLHPPLSTSHYTTLCFLSLAARSTARTGRPHRAASSLPSSAEPLPLGLLPPHPRSIRGACRLARRPATAASRRANSACGGGAQRPFHACGGRAAAPAGADRGGWGAAAAGGKDGDEESSSSSSDSSDEEAEREEEEKTGEGGGSTADSTDDAGAGSDRLGGSRREAAAAGAAAGSGEAAANSGGIDKNALRAEVSRHDADGGEEDADAEGEYDYRSIGSEIFEDGDLEAGETMQGMYDFVDDIVETQHVPTIQDPFDHKGRFHRWAQRGQRGSGGGGGDAFPPSVCALGRRGARGGIIKHRCSRSTDVLVFLVRVGWGWLSILLLFERGRGALGPRFAFPCPWPGSPPVLVPVFRSDGDFASTRASNISTNCCFSGAPVSGRARRRCLRPARSSTSRSCT